MSWGSELHVFHNIQHIFSCLGPFSSAFPWAVLSKRLFSLECYSKWHGLFSMSKKKKKSPSYSWSVLLETVLSSQAETVRGYNSCFFKITQKMGTKRPALPPLNKSIMMRVFLHAHIRKHMNVSGLSNLTVWKHFLIMQDCLLHSPCARAVSRIKYISVIQSARVHHGPSQGF